MAIVLDAYTRGKQKELLKEKVRLDKEIARISKYQDIGSSSDDNAQEVEIVGENVALENDLKKETKEVEAALARIEKSAYGKCLKCRQPINKLRLNAYPAAAYCRDHSK